MMNRSGREQTRAEDGIDVLGIGADRGDESARALDAHAPQHLFARGICLDGQEALLHRRLHALGVALDDDEGDALPGELARDDASHAPEAAQDEVVLQLIEHACAPPDFEPFGEAPLGEQRHEEREGVEERPDAAQDDEHRERAAGLRQRMDLAVPDGRDGDDRHVERVPQVPTLDEGVADRADDRDGRNQGRHQPPAGPPGEHTSACGVLAHADGGQSWHSH